LRIAHGGHHLEVHFAAAVKTVHQVGAAALVDAGQEMAGEVAALDVQAHPPAGQDEDRGQAQGDAAALLDVVDQVAVEGVEVVGLVALEALLFEEVGGQGEGVWGGVLVLVVLDQLVQDDAQVRGEDVAGLEFADKGAGLLQGFQVVGQLQPEGPDPLQPLAALLFHQVLQQAALASAGRLAQAGQLDLQVFAPAFQLALQLGADHGGLVVQQGQDVGELFGVHVNKVGDKYGDKLLIILTAGDRQVK
jgi:hypothetical protein